VKNAKAFAKKLKSLIDLEGKSVIDYGAGTGLVTFFINDEAKEVLSMDNSKGMLDELDRKIDLFEAKNVKTMLHDIHYDKMPKGYDLFVSSMTLHHIKSTKLFIKKAKESLKEGGYLAISDLITEDGSFHSRGNDGVYHFGFDLEELKREFKKQGLKVIFSDIIEVIKKEREYEVFLIVGKYE
jgi:2-polyprenyl-3-methyl-5-hydroxy-6-metoxy-1,4-benzoquinol methylase